MQNGFLKAIREEYPNEEVTKLVFADWCLENEPELEEKLRCHIPPCDDFKPYTGIYWNSGGGLECGYGLGYGYCFGNGRYHFTVNESVVRVRLSDFNLSAGYPPKIDKFTYYNLRMPKLYTNQMVFLPFGFVFCGYVVDQVEPYMFKLVNASLIFKNFDTSWSDLANNKILREVVIFKKFGKITIGPQFCTSMDWKGDLP